MLLSFNQKRSDRSARIPLRLLFFLYRNRTGKRITPESITVLFCDAMSTRNEIAEQILNYLKKHPASADSLEGIAGWWLKSERVDEAVDKVAETLEGLIKSGSIKRVKYENGTILYMLAKQ